MTSLKATWSQGVSAIDAALIPGARCPPGDTARALADVVGVLAEGPTEEGEFFAPRGGALSETLRTFDGLRRHLTPNLPWFLDRRTFDAGFDALAEANRAADSRARLVEEGRFEDAHRVAIDPSTASRLCLLRALLTAWHFHDQLAAEEGGARSEKSPEPA